jgi:hypothetical protein
MEDGKRETERLRPVGRPDPHPYDGPIERADGVRPYNRYLWPTESWWPTHQREFYGCLLALHFGFVALADGRYSTAGETYSIKRGLDIYGRPCVYASREAAIRVSGARMIREIRRRVKDRGKYFRPSLTPEMARAMIEWTRRRIADACGQSVPVPIRWRPTAMPPPVDALADTPLGLWAVSGVIQALRARRTEDGSKTT